MITQLLTLKKCLTTLSQDINELIIKNLNSKIIDEISSQKNLEYIIFKKINKKLNISSFSLKKIVS